MNQAFIAIGSNIAPAENVAQALRLLACRVRITRMSTVYLSAAEGRPEQPPYYNCAVAAETVMAPQELKRCVLRPIEDALGRVRSDDKYAARTIDLDLIAYDDLAIATDDCVLPDPQIAERAFLAIPLCEVAPEWVLSAPRVAIATVAARVRNRQLEPLEAYTQKLRDEIIPGGNR